MRHNIDPIIENKINKIKQKKVLGFRQFLKLYPNQDQKKAISIKEDYLIKGNFKVYYSDEDLLVFVRDYYTERDNPREVSVMGLVSDD